jgi:hypothetical protein
MVALMYQWFLLSFVGLFAAPTMKVGEGSAFHPFYVSVAEINYNAAEKNLEISCKIFADDFEAALKKNNKVAVDLASEKTKAANDAFIAAYVRQHLTIVADGKPLTLQYVGFEKEKEAAWCYFEVPLTAVPKKFDVHNSILHDFTNDQINLIHVNVGGKRQSTKLNFPDKAASFVF